MLWILHFFIFAQPTAYISSPSADETSSTLQPYFLSGTSFDANTTNYRYLWTLSTGETFDGATQSLPPFPEGTVEISLVVENEAGERSAPDTRKIYVMGIHDFPLAPSVTGVDVSARNIHTGQIINATAASMPQDSNMTFLWFWHNGREAFRAEGSSVDVQFPTPLWENSNYNLSVIAKDAQNRYSFQSHLSKVTIYIGEGNLPPEGRILEPPSSTTVLPQTMLHFQGDGFDNEGDEPLQFSWLLPDGTQQDGRDFDYLFTENGNYSFSLNVTDALGNQDPNPPSITIAVQDFSGEKVGSVIQFPQFHQVLFEGDTFNFNGFSSLSTSNLNIDGYWTIQNLSAGSPLSRFEGNDLSRVAFPTQGLYYVTYNAEYSGLMSERTRHNARWVAVRDRTRSPLYPLSFENPGHDVVQNGSQIHLELELDDLPASSWHYNWMVNGELLDAHGSEIDYSVSVADDEFGSGPYDSGIFNLEFSVIALDSNGRAMTSPTYRNFNIYRNAQPAIITLDGYENTETIFLPQGSSFQPMAIVDNPTNLDMVYTWSLQDGAGMYETYSGLDPGPLQFNTEGLFYLSLQAISADGTLSAGRSIFNYIHVYDPQLELTTRITRPLESSLIVDSGTTLGFEGLVEDPSFIAPPQDSVRSQLVSNQPEWVHTMPDGTTMSYLSASPEILFQAPGQHTVTLHATNTLGLTAPLPDSIAIEVVTPTPDRFEPNNTPEQAALLGGGAFSGLELSEEDPVDWYYFENPNAASSLKLEFDLVNSTQNIDLFAYNSDLTMIDQSALLAGRNNFLTLDSVPEGSIFLKFALPDGQKQKAGLSFGLSLNTLKPQLVFPYAYFNELKPFAIHIINPESQVAQVVIEGWTAFGQLLGQHQSELSGLGKFQSTVTSLFPGISPTDLAWIQIKSDVALLGMGTQVSSDQQTGIAEPAMKGSFQELIVPHIALRTDQWYTHSSIVNSSEQTVIPEFWTPTTPYGLLAPSLPYEADLLDFFTFFGGQIPSDGSWGRFVDQSQKTSLAGWEQFGKKDGNLQVASISMIPTYLKNSNFTYVRRDIYFPHIAADTASFWTGMSIVNTGSYAGTGTLKAYDVSGSLLAEQPISLPVGGKQVDVVPGFFPSLAPDTPIAWIQLETGDYFQGFELFGSNDGTNRRLAGFPAMSGASQLLHFAYTDSDLGSVWTGLALVNVTDQPGTLTYEGFDSKGNVVTSANRPIGGLQKDVALLQTLFGTVPQNLAWVRVTSSQPVAGFLLFGDNGSNFMAGSLAQ